MKDLTSSSYTFEKLIRGNFLYVDKTEFIWKLVRPATGLYFLSRPRRFGKSLTLSTLKAVFEGRSELFEGLAIAKKGYGWKPYPVIHLDLNGLDFSTPEELETSLQALIREQADSHGVPLAPSSAILMLRDLIGALAAQEQVVVLVDEYDKPILSNLDPDNPDRAQAILERLKPFYSVLKACEPLEHFVLVTGVSKFSHVSMFSELNNLTDLSMHPDFATMLGYTQEELEAAFDEHIADATRHGVERAQLLADLKEWYDGYRFHHAAAPVYNPVSVARFFDGGAEFDNYWFDTGTPTFLLNLMENRDYRLEDALGRPVPRSAFRAFDIRRIDPLVLLYQTGYLTIRDAKTDGFETLYRLDFPNREVGMSFSSFLLDHCARKTDSDTTSFISSLAAAMRDGDMPLLRATLDAFLAGVPYDLHRKSENNFQNIIYAIFRLLGYRIRAEERSSRGRADAVCKTSDWIYIFEFKLDGDTSALAQIHDRRYYASYLADPRRIMLVGVALDTAKGTIADWQCEELDRAGLDATPSPADSNCPPSLQETK